MACINQSINNVIFGISGTKLTPNEYSFFKKTKPLGFILFTRNCVDHEQILALIDSLKQCVGRDDIIIGIDQEGGRVARLKPPLFPSSIPAAAYGALAYISVTKARIATYINHLTIGLNLRKLGINLDFAPVADLHIPGAHSIIGDRSFSDDIRMIAMLCKEADRGLADAQVQSVIKHIPGHGRAKVDSHESLPVVDEDLKLLSQTDFAVFNKLTHCKLAMTAHILFKHLDPDLPVTFSSKAIKYIRKQIGFNGLIITDDLSMKALTGSYQERAKKASDAGCDILLHCNGDLSEMEAIAENITTLSTETMSKIRKLHCYSPVMQNDLYIEKKINILLKLNKF